MSASPRVCSRTVPVEHRHASKSFMARRTVSGGRSIPPRIATRTTELTCLRHDQSPLPVSVAPNANGGTTPSTRQGLSTVGSGSPQQQRSRDGSQSSHDNPWFPNRTPQQCWWAPTAHLGRASYGDASSAARTGSIAHRTPQTCRRPTVCIIFRSQPLSEHERGPKNCDEVNA